MPKPAYVPVIEELYSRYCPSPVLTVVAIAVRDQSVTWEEAQQVRVWVANYILPLSAPRRLVVVVTDETGYLPIIRKAQRSERMQAFVVELLNATHPFNFWGSEVVKGYSVAYVPPHRLMESWKVIPQLSATVAHELGHQFGLGHSYNDNRDDLMTIGYVTPQTASYIERNRVWRVLHRKIA